MLHKCPQCHHTDLHLHALIRAVLHSTKDGSGAVQLSLLEWDRVASVDHYECLNCVHVFIGENNI
jgi:hypothetical protein